MSVLLTGFPGFIGRRLVRTLCEQGDGRPIIALVEPRMADAARDVAAQIDGPVEVLTGDISKQRLDLDRSSWDRLTSEVTQVFHLAAIYDLAVVVEDALDEPGADEARETCEEDQSARHWRGSLWRGGFREP